MLLGEHINILRLYWCLFASLTEYFFSFSSSMVELLKDEDEEDGLALATR
jgi:hypothetical protein